ncbi:chemotaxis protein CheW [Methylotenera sp.]|uniref:chemotaxis protein CheW n=1 Tax=Methylotenera sp. TaxID=2051956 RepID=UPI00248A6B82|nr:chemotaxis protein CheW [Methylotenera sp.]MDI1362303.1 chemotaxis protein CheW [Methylotenera sp.]
MAKTSNLREFQEAILLRLKEATAKGGAVSTSRLGVAVGSKRILINLHEVSEVLPVPPMQHVPLTLPWFLGVANVRGNLYNITDLAQFMGLPPTPKSINNRIVLINSEVTTQVAVVIDSLVGLRSVEAMKRKPVSKNNKNKEMFLSENSYEDVDKNEWFELNVEALVQDKAFIQPTIS